MIVLDCSAALAISKDTPEGRAISGLRLATERVFAPTIFEYELCYALWKDIRLGAMSRELANNKMDESIDLVDEFVPAREYLREVLSESARLNHPAYDIFYFVLARRLGATLFALDKRLVKLCEQEGVDCIHTVRD